MFALGESERIRSRTYEKVIHGLVGLALQQAGNLGKPENWSSCNLGENPNCNPGCHSILEINTRLCRRTAAC